MDLGFFVLVIGRFAISVSVFAADGGGAFPAFIGALPFGGFWNFICNAPV
jgi:hypothetical protein